MPFLAAISPGVLFFLIVGFIGFVVLAAKRHQEKLDQAWTTAGSKLDLSYSTRKSGGSTQRKLVGHFRKQPVKINTFTEGSGKSKKTYTRYRLRYPHLGLGIELSQQHFFSGLKSALTGRQDIQIGSKEFDDAVIVQGGSSHEVIDYLTRERQLAIQGFLTSKRRGIITDDEASFISNGVVDDLAKIQQSLEALHSLSLALATDPIPVSQRDRRPLEERTPEPAIDLPLGSAVPMPEAAPADEDLDRLAGSSAPGAAGVAAALSGDGGVQRPPARDDDPLDRLIAEPRVRSGEAPEHAIPPSLLDPVPAELSPEPGPAVEPEPPAQSAAAELPPVSDARRDLAALAEDLGTGVPVTESVLGSTAAPEESAAAPEPAPSPVAASADLDYVALRADLFQSERMSYETKEHFEATYAGRTVRWQGKLERLSSFSSDLVFAGSGVKATVELEPFQDGSFAKDVEAIVQLPSGTDADLKDHVGTEVVLTGKLVACDAFMRKLMIADGLLEQA